MLNSIELDIFLENSALLLLLMSELYQKIANENFTSSLKKNYHVMCTTFVEVITQYSSNHEDSKILPIFANKNRII